MSSNRDFYVRIGIRNFAKELSSSKPYEIEKIIRGRFYETVSDEIYGQNLSY
jgi:hypothetical protein